MDAREQRRQARRAAGALALAALAATAGAGGAGAQSYPSPSEPRPSAPAENPCAEQAKLLRCPDLRMGPPSQLYARSHGGKVVLHARNDIRSRGEGPLELRGRRSSKRYMRVRQAIRTRKGKRKVFDTDGRLVFYNIPGQGPYWKFHHAAVFQIFSLDKQGKRGRLLRKGPKADYCFRDLKRTRPGRKSPRRRVYPACSQDPGRRGVTLGTSVGWSDIYPADYYQNWINVTGLRGCFAFVMVADPRNSLFENDESNNEGSRRIRLPAKGGRVRRC